jgi:hypothetical protein
MSYTSFVGNSAGKVSRMLLTIVVGGLRVTCHQLGTHPDGTPRRSPTALIALDDNAAIFMMDARLQGGGAIHMSGGSSLALFFTTFVDNTSMDEVSRHAPCACLPPCPRLMRG